MSHADDFKNNRYTLVKDLIPKDLCRVVTKYALLKEQNEFEPELGKTAQVFNAHSVYGDTLMETMLHFIHPHMEKITGLSLCPTYSYYRVYRPGMVLERHRDRPSCEISTTVCFGYNYINDDPEYKWSMYVEPDVKLPQDPGDLIVYRGCDVDHWREPFDAGEGSYLVQAFLHFVDKHGPHYPEYKYDQRPNLGWKTPKKNDK